MRNVLHSPDENGRALCDHRVNLRLEASRFPTLASSEVCRRCKRLAELPPRPSVRPPGEVELELELRTDPTREDVIAPIGVAVLNVLRDDGSMRVADLAHLDRESLARWLRSRGGDNALAENCVGYLLGHQGVLRR